MPTFYSSEKEDEFEVIQNTIRMPLAYVPRSRSWKKDTHFLPDTKDFFGKCLTNHQECLLLFFAIFPIPVALPMSAAWLGGGKLNPCVAEILSYGVVYGAVPSCHKTPICSFCDAISRYWQQWRRREERETLLEGVNPAGGL